MIKSNNPKGERDLNKRKPESEHKKQLTVTLEPEHVEFVNKYFKDLGYRSKSHLVDQAIEILMKARQGEHK